MILKPDATIEDVLPTLSNPEEYIRIVLGHLSACKKAHGNASVRIGITGKGVEPSHKITYVDQSGVERVFQAYSGNNPFTDVAIHQNTWSTAALSFDRVAAILGGLRGYKPAAE